MSFTADVKTELSAIEMQDESMKRAYAYGFLLFGKSFNIRSISCSSDYKCVIDSFSQTIQELICPPPNAYVELPSILCPFADFGKA